MILNAVMCVWNEEDIIESTVKHAFAQGCSNVFVIDNASTDKTVDIAINAGAKLVAQFETKDFNEDQKVAYLNSVVKKYNEQNNEDQIWWLYNDADEFPNFDYKFTILDILKELDSSVRAIHGHMFDHIPTHQPYNIQGYHPADFQPLCTKITTSKTPLLRYDKNHPHLWSTGGAHDFVTNGESIPILRNFLMIHHFPIRNPMFTFQRTKILAQTRNEWMKDYLIRIKAPKTFGYDIRYKNLKMEYNKNRNAELKTNTLIYNYKHIVRWYDIFEEKKFACSNIEKIICDAIFYFFMQEYDTAFRRFNDAFDMCNDDYIKLWLMIKIAECLAPSNVAGANDLIFSVKKYDNVELNTYIEKYLDFSVNKSDKSYNSINDLLNNIDFYISAFPLKKDIASFQDNLKVIFSNFENKLNF